MSQSPSLSKSRFMAGQQCHKRLYLECFHRDLADEFDPGTQARFEEGRRIGELARALRPGGVLIEDDHLHTREAIESTKKALANPQISVIYEAAFQYQDVIIRVDILARVSPQAFEFIEVKSSTKVKPEYKSDVGIQLWVLEGAGLLVDRALLAHINNAYEYSGVDPFIDQFFFTHGSDFHGKKLSSLDQPLVFVCRGRRRSDKLRDQQTSNGSRQSGRRLLK